ncbi:MAG TPA: hypothetical protein VFK23_07260, partial [Nitrospirota bacterium]|nr:hypothetical protein [Nitrospirota bacterium]
MNNKIQSRSVFLLVVFAAIIGIPVIAGAQEQDIPKKFFVPPPPFSPGIFPCSQCHQGMPVNRRPRKLEQMHQDITLKHMPGGWCFDCHNPDN